MKYIKSIKKYENTQGYKEDDFVVVDPIVFKTTYKDVPKNWLPFDFPIGQMGMFDSIEYYTGFISHVHKIIRKATKEEIEQYEIRKNLFSSTNKYNL